MKYILLAFSLILITSSLFAQEYLPMVKSNSLYNYTDGYCINPHYSKLYRFSADTLIGLYNYKQVQASSDSINFSNTYLYFREDTVQQRVYMLHGHSEGLLYDFSLNTGDTVTIHNVYYGSESHLIDIDSTKNIMIGGQLRKVLYYRRDVDRVWIEGIGAIDGLYFPGEDVYGLALKLVCYYENTILQWLNSDYNDCFFLFAEITENTKSNLLQIFPNPATYFIRIDNIEENTSFQIFNIFGKLVQSGQTSENGIIEICDLKSGVFFVKLDNNERAVGRFIKIYE